VPLARAGKMRARRWVARPLTCQRGKLSSFTRLGIARGHVPVLATWVPTPSEG
jgi:hypothetical protein